MKKLYLRSGNLLVKLYSLVVTLDEGIILIRKITLENFRKDLFEVY